MIHTSPTTLGALRKPLVLPVMQFLFLGFLALLLLLFAFSSLARHFRAGSTVAGLACSRFDPLALIIRQVSHSLREGQQHLAFDGPVLGPSTACPTAGLPATRDEAGDDRQDV